MTQEEIISFLKTLSYDFLMTEELLKEKGLTGDRVSNANKRVKDIIDLLSIVPITPSKA